MIKEFKEFIARGNVMDMAVGIVVGGAFTAIVNSLVNDLIMPLIGILIGGIDFASLSVQVGDAVFAYGNFIQNVLNFLVIAFTVFLIVKGLNKMRAASDKAAEKLGIKKEEETNESSTK